MADGLDFQNLMQWGAVLALVGGLWWRFKQWGDERDNLTRWRTTVDHAVQKDGEAIGRLDARQSALEKEWRDLWQAHTELRAKLEARQ